jgi:transposase
MAAYSLERRQNILRAWERRFSSPRTIADVFGVSVAFVEKVLRQHRPTGNMAPKPHAGGQTPRLDAPAHAMIQRVVSHHPDATLQELGAGLAAATGIRVSVATRGRALRRRGRPRKKRRSTPASATPHASSRRARTTAGGSRGSTSGA